MKRSARDRRRVARRAFTLAVVVFVGVSPIAAADGMAGERSHLGAQRASDEGFTVANGDCRETGAFLAVDSERVMRYLPDEFSDHFAVTEVGAKAVIGVVSIACRDVVLDGREGLTWNTNEAIVVVDPPDACRATHNACEGFHHYLLWGPMDNPLLAARYDRLGALNRSFVPPRHNAVAITLGTVTNTAEATLRDQYLLSAQTVSGWAATPDRRQTEWQLGNRGLVADSYQVFGPELWSAGQITISPQPGSALADILDTDEPFTVGGFITQLHGTDTVELVPFADEEGS